MSFFKVSRLGSSDWMLVSGYWIISIDSSKIQHLVTSIKHPELQMVSNNYS